MDMNEYQEQCRRTQRKDLPLWAMREHALYGLSSEVGEVCGLHQKVHQGHVMDEAALRLEIGDCLWFIAELCDCYGWSMADVAMANIQKLRVRYKEAFTPEESRKRVDLKPTKLTVRSRYYSKARGVEK